mgnify:CR=1 FL=1
MVRSGRIPGRKILYWITEWKSILENPGFLSATLTDGFVVFGGIVGGIFTAYVYCRVKKLNFLKLFDTLMPSVALAQGFGRIGCLLAGCCYGKETSGAFSITFHTSAFAPNGVALVPTQIYSSILDFLHYGLLLLILRSQKKDGETAAAYLIFIVQEDLCWSFSAEIWQEEVWSAFYVAVYFSLYIFGRNCDVGTEKTRFKSLK